MNNVVVIYWTSTGNTQIMADTFASAVGVKAIHVSDFDISTINEYTHIALGCPACGDEELDDTEFLPFFESVLPQLSNKHIALFGSYGWGDGEWMKNWENQIVEQGALLFEEGQMALETPDQDTLTSLEEFAQRFVA